MSDQTDSTVSVETGEVQASSEVTQPELTEIQKAQLILQEARKKDEEACLADINTALEKYNCSIRITGLEVYKK